MTTQKGNSVKSVIEKYLHKQSEGSMFIRAYYEKAKAWDKHMYTDERPIPTLEQVLAEADGQRFHGRGLAIRFARNASPEELRKLVQAAMDEPDIQTKVKLLWPFGRINNFPFPENILLQLRHSEDDRLRDIAFEIMGQNPSPKIREFALSLIQSGEDVMNGVSLLSKNLRPEDEDLLYASVKSFPVHHNEWAWHSVFTAARNGIKVTRVKPKSDILEYIYHHMLSGSCREYTIRLMHRKKVLSDKILDLSQNSKATQIQIMNGTNQSHSEAVPFSFVPVSVGEDIKSFNTSVDIFYNNTSFRQLTIMRL